MKRLLVAFLGLALLAGCGAAKKKTPGAEEPSPLRSVRRHGYSYLRPPAVWREQTQRGLDGVYTMSDRPVQLVLAGGRKSFGRFTPEQALEHFLKALNCRRIGERSLLEARPPATAEILVDCTFRVRGRERFTVERQVRMAVLVEKDHWAGAAYVAPAAEFGSGLADYEVLLDSLEFRIIPGARRAADESSPAPEPAGEPPGAGRPF